MKKLAIAGASVALAAMPAVGVFAANTTYSSIADKIQLTVSKTCEMQADENLAATTADKKGTVVTLGTAGGQIAGTEFAEANGTSMTLTCNSVNGWTLKATATALSDSAATATTSETIPFGAYPASITPGTTTSVWSAKIAITASTVDASHATIAENWNNYAATTANSTTILSSATNTTGAMSVKDLVVTPSYKAYAQTNQASATYAGTMTYTFAENNS